MALPAQNDITNAATVADLQPEFEDQRDFISTLLGGGPRTELTVGSGTVTPGARDHGGVFTLDTQSDASTDDLDTITNTNVGDGQFIMLMAESESKVVTLKHGDGGTGEMLMNDSADYVLDTLNKWILFRRDGAAFQEVTRYKSPKDPTIQVFTAGATWNKPADLRYAIIEVAGGGGAGGGASATAGGQASSGGGGGGGGYSMAVVLASALGSSETVTVGSGGAGVSGSAGNSGGSSSFGAHATATGGSGGSGGGVTGTFSSSNSGAGGIGSGGDINAAGDSGGYGLMMADSDVISTPRGIGANGGGSALGGGGSSVAATGSPANGDAGESYGGGGGGAANGEGDSARAGGAGADGVVIVKEFF